MLSWGAGRRVRATLLALCLTGGALACGGDDGGSAADAESTSSSAAESSSSTSSSTSSSPTTSSTKAPATPEEEVEAAYLRSWDVYAKAVRELDPSGLEESYAGEALEIVRGEVERRREEQAPVRIDVDHDYTIQLLDDGAGAIVHDRYKNRSVKIDPASGQPTDPIEETQENEIYQLQELGGEWKVIVVARPD